MSYPYKVEYIFASAEKKKWYESPNAVDAWTLSKELEALLLEYHSKGYALTNITPIQTSDAMGYSRTDGLMVTFKKSDI